MAIKAYIRPTTKITVTVKETSPQIAVPRDVGTVVKDMSKAKVYNGSYSVTPSATEQTLPIADMLATRDIVINPIPSNYGLITWDGTTLTVS